MNMYVQLKCGVKFLRCRMHHDLPIIASLNPASRCHVCLFFAHEFMYLKMGVGRKSNNIIYYVHRTFIFLTKQCTSDIYC